MQTFKKEERLCDRSLIDSLFKEGKSFMIYPIRVTWKKGDPGAPFPARVLIIVSRKKFPSATGRNLIKRRIREAYRKNKAMFYQYLEARDEKCILSLNYYGNTMNPYRDTDRIIMLILQRLIREYEKISG
jgi:ribonuclease P protein component